jgi:hypothetical protein
MAGRRTADPYFTIYMSTKPVLNTIRSVAFLLEEIEDTNINGIVKAKVPVAVS